MSALSEKAKHRLAKLIPLLGSDKAGERQATVSAMASVLTAAGLDWHDLAAAVGGAEIVEAQRPPQIAPAPTWAELTHQERLGWLKAILKQNDLGDLERDRLTDLYNRELTFGFNPTKKRLLLLNEHLARAYAKRGRP